MDDIPSWIVLDELNVFAWPGFDLRPVPGSDPATCVYGILPRGFFEMVKRLMLDQFGERAVRVVKRRE